MFSSDLLTAINAAAITILPLLVGVAVTWLRAEYIKQKQKLDDLEKLQIKAVDQSRKNSDLLEKNTRLTEEIRISSDGNNKRLVEALERSTSKRIEEAFSRRPADEEELDRLEQSFFPRKEEK